MKPLKLQRTISMMNIKRRRYYQYSEKETHSVSLRWKVLHSILFLLLVISSFLAVFAFHSICNMFNFRCILYSKPSFSLKHIEYRKNEITDLNGVTEEVSKVTNITKEDNSSVTFLNLKASNTSDLIIIYDKYWFSNSTMEGVVAIDSRKTDYSSLVMCDMVIFNTMISMIFAAFFSVIVIICGRGGRGHRVDILPQPWLYVYPMLIVTSIMVIINIITTNLVINGLRVFCSGFQEFTEQTTCSNLVTYLLYTQGPRGELRNHFYTMYRICLYSFYIGVVLWVLQLILTLLRILCVVDFQLNSVTVACTKQDAEETHEVLVKAFPGLTEDKKFASLEEKHQLTQTTTQL